MDTKLKRTILERKIRYDGTVSEYVCVPLAVSERKAALFYLIEHSFTLNIHHTNLMIPAGSYTIAYYWADRPYNVYLWRDGRGQYLGAYFNIVRNTMISHEMVLYEDLIVDVLVLPDGALFVLDEHELPEPMDRFENGLVQQAVSSLTASLPEMLADLLAETDRTYGHVKLVPYIK